LVERRASNRKIAKPWFYSRCGSTSLCPWKRHLMLFPTLEPSSLPAVVAQADERHTNWTASVLEWYDRYRAYYNIWFKRRRKENQRVKMMIPFSGCQYLSGSLYLVSRLHRKEDWLLISRRLWVTLTDLSWCWVF